jgi:hypothetical protein
MGFFRALLVWNRGCTIDRTLCKRGSGVSLLHWVFWLITLPVLFGPGEKAGHEEGEFKIVVQGKEVGSEHYVLAATENSASSSSVLNFRNPSNAQQKVQMESKLDMDGHFRPRSYQLRSDVDGKKGSIVGTFNPNAAMFEYQGGPAPTKKGLLVGNDYTILDTNMFHHFIFLVRLYNFDSKEKLQRFEVVIPQEADSGVLKISEANRETLSIGEKKVETRHLQVDSGSLLIHLWVDKQLVLHKISVPSSGTDVVRVR